MSVSHSFSSHDITEDLDVIHRWSYQESGYRHTDYMAWTVE